MDESFRLAAIEEIRILKARYFRFVDTKRWDELKALFTPDATFASQRSHLDETLTPIDGLDAFVAYARQGLQNTISAHHGYMPEIDILTADSAKAIWAMDDLLVRPNWRLHGYGHYHEAYRRTPGGWRIASWKLTRMLVEIDETPA